MKTLLTIFIIVFPFWACQNQDKPQQDNYVFSDLKSMEVPDFDADSAYHYIKIQVDFGPRVPNTESHEKCADFLIGKLEAYCADVMVQKTTVKTYNGKPLQIKNIIGRFNPQNNQRILLFAHWDTRPFADYCPDPERRNEPIPGANDGASGVGVLLEIARQLKILPPKIGVDIIFFDAEDYGQPAHLNLPAVKDDWCLGSQYWAINPHEKDYFARFGILLDMVGARDALFTKEGTSVYYAANIVDRVWRTAQNAGYERYFSDEKTIPITDDHFYINQRAKIPSIAIIEYDHETKTKFGKYWHTHNDNMKIIDKATLKAVGQTVLHVVYIENQAL